MHRYDHRKSYGCDGAFYFNFVTCALLYRNIYSIKELQHNTGVN